MSTDNVTPIDDASFDASVATGLTAVKFSAEWCGPCHMLAPVVESLAAELAPRVKFFDIDADANAATAARFGVRGLPTVLLFQDGAPVGSVVGFVPKERLRARITEVLDAQAA